MHPSILLALAAGLCWGIGEVFTKSVLQTHAVGPITAIAVRSTVALPLLWIVYAVSVHRLGHEPTTWPHAGAGTLAKLLLGSGVMAGAAGMACFYLALHGGEISRVKPIAFTVAPTVAVLLGWLALGEAMTPRKAIAIVLVLVGVVLLASERAPNATG